MNKKFHYLQAERLGPRLFLEISDFQVQQLENLGSQGEYAAHFLFVNENKTLRKTTLESDSRIEQFRQQLTIKCPDGKTRLFSWHLRMTPGAWRLYFSEELKPGKIIIGYINLKLK